REGHARYRRAEDLGDWNLWTSAAAPGADGKAAPGSPGFQIDKHTLDVALEKDGEHLHASARIDLHASASGRIGLAFSLADELAIESVQDESGRPLASDRDGDELLV